MRNITYCQAIQEATEQEMTRDSSVFCYGIGVPDHKTIFGSVEGILEKFGEERCFDTPIAEESMLGIGLGAAINGMRPIHIHIRVDFLLLALNQLINMISSIQYGTCGILKAPIVIRVVAGRGWGQGYQHSKTLHSLFSHIPGLKVALPVTPYDAKGLLTTAIRDNNPVIFIEHRWLYWQMGEVPKKSYEVPFGKGNFLRKGKNLTIVAFSWMAVEAMQAIDILKKEYGIEIDLIDPRTSVPLDIEMIEKSVQKTGRCLVLDNDWLFCGLASEIVALVQEKCFAALKAPIKRIGFEAVPCPTARHSENQFYPNAISIIKEVEKMLDLGSMETSNIDIYSHENRFKGPF